MAINDPRCLPLFTEITLRPPYLTFSLPLSRGTVWKYQPPSSLSLNRYRYRILRPPARLPACLYRG